jgi:hypothetical protein
MEPEPDPKQVDQRASLHSGSDRHGDRACSAIFRSR